MGQKLLFTLGITLLFFGSSFQETHSQTTARVKQVKINSNTLQQQRELFIYTPPQYDENPFSYYDVIYVFDAQARHFFDYTHAMLSFLRNAPDKFIVVGILATHPKNPPYGRNSDFMPHDNKKTSTQGQTIPRNATNFLAYIQSEVIPYINQRYRTQENLTAIAHSLGASFLVYAMTQSPHLFNNYIFISPNLAFDNQQFMKLLLNFDFNQLKPHSFLYFSSASEGKWFDTRWKRSRQKAHQFLSQLKSEQVHIKVEEFPEESHSSTIPVSINSALKTCFDKAFLLQKKQPITLSAKTYEITIRVTVPNKDDTIYITGNQSNLGNWHPGKIKLHKISDLRREVKLKLKSPIQFKFTQGS